MLHVIYYDMRCQGIFSSTHRPYMDMMYPHHMRQGYYVLAQVVYIYVLRHAVQCQPDAVVQQLPCTDQDYQSDNQTDNRIYDIPSGKGNNDSADNNACAHHRICCHMQKGTANVQIILLAAQKEKGSDPVHQYPYTCRP